MIYSISSQSNDCLEEIALIDKTATRDTKSYHFLSFYSSLILRFNFMVAL